MEKDKKKSLSSSSLEEIQSANRHAALSPEFRKAPPLAVARKPHNQGGKRQRAWMHECVWDGECELAGTADARFEKAVLGYSHIHAHTHTRQTKKRQAPGGWGSPQERMLAHRGGRNWALFVIWASSLFTSICLDGYFCCHFISSFISSTTSFKLFTCLTFSSVCISQSSSTIKVVVAQADYTFEFIFT